MKKIGYFLLFLMLYVPCADALNMVKRETYFDKAIYIAGLPDYPPYSYYERGQLKGALVDPTIEIMQNQGVTIKKLFQDTDKKIDPKVLLTGARSGNFQLFAGAYANTDLFTGLNMLYPAVITNPIHIITLYDKKEENIRSVESLKELHGVVSKAEYFNDFILKKIEKLNIEFVETTLEAYKKVILGKADYMLGGIYYNRIMIAKYGVGDYLTYSEAPLFKMPIFVAMSKVTPHLSLFVEAFKTEFSKPDYSRKVKEELIRIMNEFATRYAGVVPPSFSQHGTADEVEALEDIPDIGNQEKFHDEPEFDDNITGAYIVEKDEEEKPHINIEDIFEKF